MVASLWERKEQVFSYLTCQDSQNYNTLANIPIKQNRNWWRLENHFARVDHHSDLQEWGIRVLEIMSQILKVFA